jgi:hypothetical protein
MEPFPPLKKGDKGGFKNVYHIRIQRSKSLQSFLNLPICIIL